VEALTRILERNLERELISRGVKLLLFYGLLVDAALNPQQIREN
jgi:hypothetical protein